MKKICTLLTSLVLAVSLLAQAPQSFNYQAVVRDAGGNIIVDTQVGMKISILQSSTSGTAVCIEEFTPTTNDFGLVTLAIGSVSTTDFAAIDWSAGPYFVKVELDPAGGTSYTEMGISQLLSVPYALHAETVENITETDPVFGAHASNGITSTNIANWTTAYGWGNHSAEGYLTGEVDGSVTNEIQAISINNDTLYLSNGGEVYLGYLLDNTDTQKLVLNDYLLGITNGNEITLPSVWRRIDSDISYDSGTVTISAIKGNIQLNLPDAFGAGGHNLIIGDDSYLTDIDMYNTMGIFGMTDSTIGAIKLGSDGPVLSGSAVKLSVNKEMDMNNQKIVNLADPVNDKDAATKTYVDELLSKISELEVLSTKLKDYDGNLYSVVKIGDQIWMAENLRTSTYNDGTPIAKVTDNTAWSNLTTGAYCWYNNDSDTYENPYGKLYNWYAVDTGKLCPTGWHVPADAEWTTLTDYLGGESVAGGKLKETYTTHWDSPNTGATNESGFTALPGGYRDENGTFNDVSYYGYWWLATEDGASSAWYCDVHYADAGVSRFSLGKRFGFSVRCLRDE